MERDESLHPVRGDMFIGQERPGFMLRSEERKFKLARIYSRSISALPNGATLKMSLLAINMALLGSDGEFGLLQ
jgi:hypothetical protein